MAGCERGYLCIVCGEDVEEITDSVLYLRYVLGEVDWNDLDRSPEKHIRCDPVLAQFIVCGAFEPVNVDGVFAKGGLDPEFVRSENGEPAMGLASVTDGSHEVPFRLQNGRNNAALGSGQGLVCALRLVDVREEGRAATAAAAFSR
jgi:hypothetical protein